MMRLNAASLRADESNDFFLIQGGGMNRKRKIELAVLLIAVAIVLDCILTLAADAAASAKNIRVVELNPLAKRESDPRPSYQKVIILASLELLDVAFVFFYVRRVPAEEWSEDDNTFVNAAYFAAIFRLIVVAINAVELLLIISHP